MRTLSVRVLQTTRPPELASKLVGLAITDVLQAVRAYTLIRLLRFLTARLTASRACMAKKILNFLGKILTGQPVRLRVAAPYQQRQQQEHHEWSQDDWEENVSAAAAADNLEVRNAAAGHNGYAHRGYAHRWEGTDWDVAENDEWEQDPDLTLLQPDPEREGSPISAHSSLPLLESLPRTPSPSSSPQPLQLQYIPEGDARPTYALQVGPSLRLQPVQQRVALLHQLRNVLISEGEEENILSRRTAPPPPPATAIAATQFTGRCC
jgi:hypothetical protein